MPKKPKRIRLVPIESLPSQLLNIRQRMERGEELIECHREMIDEAADLIATLAKPMSPNKSAMILNDAKYAFDGWWDDDRPWEVKGSYIRQGDEELTHFEASCIAKGLWLQGGAA